MKLTRRKPKPKANPMPQELVAEPARILPGHVQDRTLSVVAGAAKGFSHDDWPISLAYKGGNLQGRGDVWHPLYNADMRWLAIEKVHDWWQTINRSQMDSIERIGRVGGGTESFADRHEEASKGLSAVYSRLSAKDRCIVEKLIDGWSLAGAVSEACGDAFKFTVRARVRDALDALIDAIRSARAENYTFDMRVR